MYNVKYRGSFMNKFTVLPCTEQENEGYKGYVSAFGMLSDSSLALLIPVTEEAAKTINYALEPGEDKSGVNLTLIGSYKMMFDSWQASGRFVSGIMMDARKDKDGDEIINVELFFSDTTSGLIEGVMEINFVQAVILAAMFDIDVIFTNEILSKLLPGHDDNGDDDDNGSFPEIDKNGDFPVDDDIIKIARNIIKGKL